MQSFEFRAASDEWLRTHEVAFLFQFLGFLVRKNSEARFAVDHLEGDSAKEECVNRLVVVDRGDKESFIQAADEFPFEQGRIGGLAIGPGIVDLSAVGHRTTKIERGILL